MHVDLSRLRPRPLGAGLALGFALLPAAPAGAQAPVDPVPLQAPVNPAAPDAARRARLEQAFSSVELPLTAKVFKGFMAAAMEMGVTEAINRMGNGAHLGPEWQAGNPYFDRARAALRRMIAKEEETAPLFDVSPHSLAAELRVDWSDDDIDFIAATLNSPFGQITVQWLDAYMAPMLIQQWSKLTKLNGFMGDSAAEIKRTADQRLIALTPDFLEASKSNDAASKRIQRLMISFNREMGLALGQRIGGRGTARLMILMRDGRPELESIVNDYKRTQGEAANRI